MRTRDAFAAVFAVALGVWIVFTTFTSDMISVSSHIGGGIDAAGYPRLLGSVAIIIGALIALSVWLAAPVRSQDGEIRKLHCLGAFLALVAYLVMLPWFGFFVSTPLLVVALMWMLGDRRPVVLAAVAVVTTAAFYVAFRHGAGILLPEGEIFAAAV